MLYCIAVVIRPFFDYQKRRRYGDGPSVDGTRIINTQRTASRARKILQMQWRAIVITVLILVYVVYLASVLMRMQHFHEYPAAERKKWFECLASPDESKASCLPLAADLGPREPELWAVLYMLIVSASKPADVDPLTIPQLAGLLGVVILFQPSMLRAWVELFKGKRRLSWRANHSVTLLAIPESHDLATTPTTTTGSSSKRISSQKRAQSGDVEFDFGLDVESART